MKCVFLVICRWFRDSLIKFELCKLNRTRLFNRNCIKTIRALVTCHLLVNDSLAIVYALSTDLYPLLSFAHMCLTFNISVIGSLQPRITCSIHDDAFRKKKFSEAVNCHSAHYVPLMRNDFIQLSFEQLIAIAKRHMKKAYFPSSRWSTILNKGITSDARLRPHSVIRINNFLV